MILCIVAILFGSVGWENRGKKNPYVDKRYGQMDGRQKWYYYNPYLSGVDSEYLKRDHSVSQKSYDYVYKNSYSYDTSD